MSSILGDLRQVVSSSSPVHTGTVTEVTGVSIVIRSPVGRREFRVPSPTAYPVGSSVRFQGEVLIGYSPGREGLPVFHV